MLRFLGSLKRASVTVFIYLVFLCFLLALIKYIRPVFVSRSDQDSRKKTVEEIKRRAHSGGEWPQVNRCGVLCAFIFFFYSLLLCQTKSTIYTKKPKQSNRYFLTQFSRSNNQMIIFIRTKDSFDMKITAFSGISLVRGNGCVKWACSDQYPVLLK